jgi:hypothetical protein
MLQLAYSLMIYPVSVVAVVVFFRVFYLIVALVVTVFWDATPFCLTEIYQRFVLQTSVLN